MDIRAKSGSGKKSTPAKSPKTKLQHVEQPKPLSFEFVPDPGSEDYSSLLKIILSEETQADHLVPLLKYLEQNICRLDVEYKTLVTTTLSINWLGNTPELISTFQAFVLNLVSAHMSYLKPCLRMLVKKFIPVEVNKLTASESSGIDTSHVHSLLKSLSEIVPMTVELLPKILEELFPYINKGVQVFSHYTQNLLTITLYLPSLRLGILELVISNMLKLDVRSPRVDISTAICVQEEDEINSRDEAMFEMDGETPGETEKSAELSVAERLAGSLPLAGTLDVMMNLCFKYIKDTCFVNGQLQWEVTKKLYRELLWVFDKYVFPTHESCHVQFLLLYICSFKEALSDGFIDYLWKKVTDPTAQCVYRQTAACYIGSFVTRAAFLPLRWGESLNFQRVITSKLNPLRVCMPIVVKTFASAARMHQLAFCDTIIERNNRCNLPVSSSKFSLEGGNKIHLESYFPFDPYLLPESSSFVVPLYREFHGSLPDVDPIEDEDEDDFLPEEDDKAMDITTMLGKSPVDLLHYSVSGWFKHA
ncbi:RNA polymerase I-specific transcription initiation factor RRN3-like [Elysia marginata]|uniref:RNA polymerase I-specific transcription initiation factor RRN3-like n=1 Tax=Elysia marginata TaxID=1093978 RepID=A0AAV4GGX9_9GAST|nr:RNA polymerase I-specific transcription initiation factor RRN3-like [Elysia marginata]